MLGNIVKHFEWPKKTLYNYKSIYHFPMVKMEDAGFKFISDRLNTETLPGFKKKGINSWVLQISV